MRDTVVGPFVKGDAATAQTIAMTLVATLFENGLDARAKLLDGPELRLRLGS